MLGIQSPSAAHMIIDGKAILNFGGSSYLGLSAEAALLVAGCSALQRYGSTAQLSRHYGMMLEPNSECELSAAEYFGVERAMYFATGYLFGLIALPGLAPHYDVALIDEAAHFSLRDGATTSGREVVTFRHCNAADAATKLTSIVSAGCRPLIATDGMFATYGEIAPLAEYARLLEPHEGWLVVDESHSFGALGAKGRGAVELTGAGGPRTIAGGSLGKAFCAYGGLALGTCEAIDLLLKAPAARGAAAGMSAGAAMAAAAMRLIRAEPERLDRLRKNGAALRSGLAGLGLPVAPSPSPIATFSLGSLDANRHVHDHLWSQGIYVIFSNYIGAGPQGAIRCAAFADHERHEIERLVTTIGCAL